NIIILPVTKDVAYALMLPRHKGWHSSYNRECKSVINRIKRDLSESESGHEITEENKGSVASVLETWSDIQYWQIVEYGRNTAKKDATFASINKMFLA
ncbi:MAG TPA: AHH domain-containing protein, partial [Myxococcaceae bacterium]